MGLTSAQPGTRIRPIDELALATELLESWERARLGPFMATFVRRIAGRLPGDAREGLAVRLADVAARVLPPKSADGPRRSARATEAGALLGLETEGLSPEGTEFELARQLVRFCVAAADAATGAAQRLSPQAAARAGTVIAARRLAPGLMAQQPPQHPRGA